MAKAPYIGKKGNFDLDDAIFGEEFHMALVHETVKAEQNARGRSARSRRPTLDSNRPRHPCGFDCPVAVAQE